MNRLSCANHLLNTRTSEPQVQTPRRRVNKVHPRIKMEDYGQTNDVVINFLKLSPNAVTPTRATPYAAGYDLYSAYEYAIPSMQCVCVDTDIAMVLPIYTYGRIASRSGLARRHNIHVAAGVIDSDYRGSIMVLLQNLSPQSYMVRRGAKIAQIICERIHLPVLNCVPFLSEQTARGDDGFGSTGE